MDWMYREIVLDVSRDYGLDVLRDCIGCIERLSPSIFTYGPPTAGRSPLWSIERSYRRWGAEPPAKLPPLGGGTPPDIILNVGLCII